MRRKSVSSARTATVLSRISRIVSGCILVAMIALTGSCSGSESSWTVYVSFNQNGLTARISLSRPVHLPLDQDDATYIMMSSGCACIGTLELVNGWWQFQSGEPGCTIRIEASTGNVECTD